MLTVLAAGAFNIGCSAVETYGAHLIMRICIAIFVAPGIALGQGVVMESYFAQQRAEKMVCEGSYTGSFQDFSSKY